MTVISFCKVARDGVHYRSTLDRRTIEQAALLVPVYAGVLEHIGFATFLAIFNATKFELALELLALDRSGEADWSLLPGDDPWIPYYWETGRVCPLPTSVGQAKRLCGPNGSYLDPVGESSGVTALTWRQKVEASSIER